MVMMTTRMTTTSAVFFVKVQGQNRITSSLVYFVYPVMLQKNKRERENDANDGEDDDVQDDDNIHCFLRQSPKRESDNFIACVFRISRYGAEGVAFDDCSKCCGGGVCTFLSTKLLLV